MPDGRASPGEVLVVDDDEAVREVLLSYFGRHGCRVAGATDGRAAIATLERSQGRYAVVVTDLSLPGADGLAVLKAARAANASCYVVIVTGYATLDSAIAAVRLGAYDYLVKPFSLGQLDVVLARIGDRQMLERENRALIAGEPTGRGAGEADLGRRLVRLEEALARIETLLSSTLAQPMARR